MALWTSSVESRSTLMSYLIPARPKSLFSASIKGFSSRLTATFVTERFTLSEDFMNI
ncbi:MAG: hypothetical protein ACD_47C00221G0005 [uncultured bacterium]|nr:MAG: hypothetical protein ACD_47C00221G0005 [uncultured bacterium]